MMRKLKFDSVAQRLGAMTALSFISEETPIKVKFGDFYEDVKGKTEFFYMEIEIIERDKKPKKTAESYQLKRIVCISFLF